jgi:hypothetical protein
MREAASPKDWGRKLFAVSPAFLRYPQARDNLHWWVTADISLRLGIMNL